MRRFLHHLTRAWTQCQSIGASSLAAHVFRMLLGLERVLRRSDNDFIRIIAKKVVYWLTFFMC